MLPRADGTKMTGYKRNGVDFERLEDQLLDHPKIKPDRERELLETLERDFEMTVKDGKSVKVYGAEGQKALDELVRYNMRRVARIAAMYVHRRRNISLFFDVVQEGVLGLYDAARTYDLRRGEKKGHRQATFGGHAKNHIKRRIREFIDSTFDVCHAPRTAYTAAFNAIAKRMESQGITITREHYYEVLANPSNGLKQKTIETLRAMPPEFLTAYFVLRTAKIYRGGNMGRRRRYGPNYYLSDKKGPERMSQERQEIVRRVREAVDSLTPTQREAILLRHLDANLEQKEISGITGISRQSVACAEKRAMSNLRERLRDLEAVVE